MHALIETHRAELLALARRRGVTGVRVFGSMSRGDGSDDSDVDLLVTLSPGTSGLALGGLLVDFIPHIAVTAELQRKLLVDNPTRLYWGN